MWGTDWPSPGIPSLRKNVDAFLALPLDDAAKSAILAGNATRIFSR